MRKVKLISIQLLKEVKHYGRLTDMEDIATIDFYDSIPDDRIIEIDECDLFLANGGHYFSIHPEMIEEVIVNEAS